MAQRKRAPKRAPNRGAGFASHVRAETRALRQQWDDERFADFGAWLIAAKYGQDRVPTFDQIEKLIERFFRTLPTGPNYTPLDFARHYSESARQRWFRDYHTGTAGQLLRQGPKKARAARKR